MLLECLFSMQQPYDVLTAQRLFFFRDDESDTWIQRVRLTFAKAWASTSVTWLPSQGHKEGVEYPLPVRSSFRR